jgi:hypothetical protein
VSKQNLKDQLNEILDLFLRPRRNKTPPPTYRAYCVEGDVPTEPAEGNDQELESALDRLLQSLPGVQGTVSRDRVREELLLRLRAVRDAGAKFTSDDANSFEQSLRGLPIEKFRVVRRIFGVDVSSTNTPLKIGDFSIAFGREIFAPFRDHPLVSLTLRSEDERQLFIECTVEAGDSRAAIELANKRFYRFELIFRVFIGLTLRRFEVGIMNYVGPQMRGQFVLSATGPVRQGSSWEGALQPYILGDSRFPMPTGAFARLFSLISRENNEFEKHVLRCAEWTGEALAESNAASALVKAAIALEVMFSANERGLISPSIMAQIAESCAFILGTETTSPIEVEHDVKRLYSVRSAVVHSGKDSVEEGDLHLLLSICRSTILLLLSKEEFAGIKTMAQLAAYFKSRKFFPL